MSFTSTIGRGLRTLMWVLIVAGVVVLAWVWLLSDFPGQERMMATVPVGFIVGLLSVVALFTIKGPWRRTARLAAAAMILVVIAIPTVFRIKGLTGDFFPVFEYRFAPKHDTMLASLPAAVVEAPPEEVAAPPADTITKPRSHEGTKDSESTKTGSATPGTNAPGTAPGTDAPGTAPSTPAPDTTALQSASFPQFLGPTRDGIVSGVKLERDWVAHPPTLVWRIPVGAGWSGFAIDRGVAITQEQRGPQEMVVAYDLATGRPLWSHGDSVRYDSVIAGDGPRATPTIAGRYVATLGSTGVLNVLDFRTGRRLWTKDIVADNEASSPEWGRSGSPLILDGKVIVSAGGAEGRSLVAYDVGTGARVWSGGSDRVGYASPILLTLLGRPQIVMSNNGTLAAHDPATGAVLWTQRWVPEPTVAMPIRVADDLVLGSTGYGIGSKLVKLTAAADGAITPAFVWETPRLKAKFTNPVLRGGYVYGLDDGVLVCMDVSNGERKWRAGRYGHGQTLLVDDLLVVTTEDGEVVLVEASPDAHREVARLPVFDAKMWNPAALAGKYLLVRSDKEAALFELPMK